MFDVLAKFEPDSNEYKELTYRIKTGQHYQQCAIDLAKGIISNPMPEEWYKIAPNLIKDGDDEETIKRKQFNMSILANRKPYFFIYNYPELKSKLKEFEDTYGEYFSLTSGLSSDDMLELSDIDEQQAYWLKRFNEDNPVFRNQCVMNKICWEIEKEFDEFLKKRFKVNDFDYTIMKSGIEVSEKRRRLVRQIFDRYRENVKMRYVENSRKVKNKNSNSKVLEITFIDNFIRECYMVCPDEKELCDIVLDICYQNNYKKQFAWMVCENQIIQNLLDKNESKFKYLEKDEDGEVEFNGIKFKLKEKVANVE